MNMIHIYQEPPTQRQSHISSPTTFQLNPIHPKLDYLFRNLMNKKLMGKKRCKH